MKEIGKRINKREILIVLEPSIDSFKHYIDINAIFYDHFNFYYIDQFYNSGICMYICLVKGRGLVIKPNMNLGIFSRV